MLVFTGKFSWLLQKQCQEARTAVCHMFCYSLSATSHSCARSECSSHHKGCPLSKLFFHFRTDYPSHRKALLWREQLSLLFCLPLLVTVAEFVVCQRPWSLWVSTEDAAGKPFVLLRQYKGPSITLFVVATATLVITALNIPNSTVDMTVVKLQLYLLAINFFFFTSYCW